MGNRDAEIKWHKLDNTANIFPVISNESLSSVYRIGVVLRDEVDPGLLDAALQRMLPWFEGMNVRLRRGIFWYYFETNLKKAQIEAEETYPCRYIDPYHNNQYLFRVSYYKNKINAEIFHALTDGYGAINFLKELTAQYLHLRYPDKFVTEAGEGTLEKTSLQVEDSYKKYYKKEPAKGYGGVVAYAMRDWNLLPGMVGVTHGFLDIPTLKDACREYGVSITQYLASVLVYSIYQTYYKARPDRHRIRINIPVNLRQFFPSETTMNFFGVVFAELALENEEEVSFESIVKRVSDNFSGQLTKEHMEELIAYNVANEQNRMLRPIPLFLKNIGIRLIYNRSSKAFTTTLSNLGLIRMSPEYEPFVEHFHFIMGVSAKQPLKCVVSSYGKELIFTFSSVFADNRLQKAFFHRLSEDGIQYRIEGNGVYQDEKPDQIPYPEKPQNREPYRLWTRGYTAAAVIMAILLLIANTGIYPQIPWSLMTGGCAAYFLLTMHFSVNQKKNPAAKVMVQVMALQVLSLLIDWVFGYAGWALNFVIPSLLLLGSGLNIAIMVKNSESWQSYLIFQVGYLLEGLLLAGLWAMQKITYPLLTIAGAVGSILIFLICFCGAEKKVQTELKKRFRI